MKDEYLHLFTMETHEHDTWESILNEAQKRALHECEQQTGFCTWADDWALVCSNSEGTTYSFEVHGLYKYYAVPELML